MKSLRAGIIGSGFMGAAHVEALRRIGGVDIRAIASIDHPRAEEIAKQFDIDQVYDRWEELLENPGIDVVHNCTPNNLHYQINRAALEAGKHVISEKPLTISSKESSELVELSKKTRRVTAINFNYRFYPVIQHARNMIRDNRLGDIYLVHGNYLQDWLYYDTDYNWRLETEISGVSRAIADIGSHWCDMLQFLTGQKIVEVFADLVTIHKKRKKPEHDIETFKGKEESFVSQYSEIEIKTEDTGSVLVHFESGTTGVFTVSQVSAGRKNYFSFEIDGSKKALAWNQEEPNQLWLGYREKPNEIIIKDPSLLDNEARTYAHYPGGHPEGYPDGPKNLFRNVYRFIREGKDPLKQEPDFPTFADGHRENLITEAVLESHKQKKWIDVKE